MTSLLCHLCRRPTLMRALVRLLTLANISGSSGPWGHAAPSPIVYFYSISVRNSQRHKLQEELAPSRLLHSHEASIVSSSHRWKTTQGEGASVVAQYTVWPVATLPPPRHQADAVAERTLTRWVSQPPPQRLIVSRSIQHLSPLTDSGKTAAWRYCCACLTSGTLPTEHVWSCDTAASAGGGHRICFFHDCKFNTAA
jgi:hypothetical protein